MNRKYDVCNNIVSLNKLQSVLDPETGYLYVCLSCPYHSIQMYCEVGEMEKNELIFWHTYYLYPFATLFTLE